ncbi:leukocyte elastase inhibitor-like [Crassostrea angulata]|uniref:leukocyte elastase inhibitor-like n=1 Tax=Magallana angulata TaxID=2784310 RepID=UPI0022B0AA5C|nr:leukocyte elastase inhibitor-like [Crassostrea angulata]
MESAVTDFSFKLYRVLCEGGGNLFMSPYSVSAALMLTMLGAKGESEEQIKQVLGVAGVPNPHQAYQKLHATLIGKSKDGAKLAIANRIFSKLGLEIKESYKKESLDYYNSEIELLDFVGNPEGSRTRINTWVEDQTNNKIKDLIPEGGINSLSLIVLTNAIYFKGDWENAFKASNTKSEPFRISGTESGTVEMMNMKKEKWLIGMSKSLDCQVLDLPYKGGELSMLIILPNKVDGLSSLESSLSADTFRELTKEMYSEDVIVSIPKFKLESSFQLDKVLGGMGITDIFSRKADFGAMMKNPPDGTHVSDVIHKAFVEVNEEGTEAAAATAVMMRFMCMPLEPMVFKADHPFLFLIRDNSTGTVLFIGRFLKPNN